MGKRDPETDQGIEPDLLIEIRKTQEALGAYVKSPSLVDKYLAKPPFRFIHDIVNNIIKETGFMAGIFSDSELDYDNTLGTEDRRNFLNKLIVTAIETTGEFLDVRPSKVLCGKEPDKTNKLLQTLAIGIELNTDTAKAGTKLHIEAQVQVQPFKNSEVKAISIPKQPKTVHQVTGSSVNSTKQIDSNLIKNKDAKLNGKPTLPSSPNKTRTRSASTMMSPASAAKRKNETQISERVQNQSKDIKRVAGASDTVTKTKDKLGKSTGRIEEKKEIKLSQTATTKPASKVTQKVELVPVDRKLRSTHHKNTVGKSPAKTTPVPLPLVSSSSSETVSKIQTKLSATTVKAVPKGGPCGSGKVSKKSPKNSKMSVHAIKTCKPLTTISSKPTLNTSHANRCADDEDGHLNKAFSKDANPAELFEIKMNLLDATKMLQYLRSLNHEEKSVTDTDVLGNGSGHLDEDEFSYNMLYEKLCTGTAVHIPGAFADENDIGEDAVCKSDSEPHTAVITDEELEEFNINLPEDPSKPDNNMESLADFNEPDELLSISSVCDQEGQSVTDEEKLDEDIEPLVPIIRPGSARPSTARRPPPSRQSHFSNISLDDYVRLPEGKVSNVILDGKSNHVNHQDGSEDSELFIPTKLIVAPTSCQAFMELGETEGGESLADQRTYSSKESLINPSQRGLLVDQIITTQNKLEAQRVQGISGSQLQIQTENERSQDQYLGEIEMLKHLIQEAAKHANPISKLLDYVGEDGHLMEKDYQSYRAESRILDLEIDRTIKERQNALKPLDQELTETEMQIKEKEAEILDSKMNILRLEDKLGHLLGKLDRVVVQEKPRTLKEPTAGSLELMQSNAYSVSKSGNYNSSCSSRSNHCFGDKTIQSKIEGKTGLDLSTFRLGIGSRSRSSNNLPLAEETPKTVEPVEDAAHISIRKWFST